MRTGIPPKAGRVRGEESPSRRLVGTLERRPLIFVPMIAGPAGKILDTEETRVLYGLGSFWLLPPGISTVASRSIAADHLAAISCSSSAPSEIEAMIGKAGG